MNLHDDRYGPAGSGDDSADPAYDEASEAHSFGGRPGQLDLDADTVLDTLIPNAIDWRETVRRYPVVSVAAVGLAGFFLGRLHGSTIVRGLATATSAAVMKQLSEVFEGDFFEFE